MQTSTCSEEENRKEKHHLLHKKFLQTGICSMSTSFPPYEYRDEPIKVDNLLSIKVKYTTSINYDVGSEQCE